MVVVTELRTERNLSANGLIDTRIDTGVGD